MRIFLMSVLVATSVAAVVASEMNPKPGDTDLCTPSWLEPTNLERTLSTPVLIQRLRTDPDKNARLLAARSLGRIGDEQAEQPLIAALQSTDKNLRVEAAWALGHFTSASEPALLGATKDNTPTVRMAAACSLGKIGTEASRPTLEQMALHDRSALVAAAARMSLHLRVGDVVPVLPVQSWLKGEQRAIPIRGKVNLVEFWATWCGPCLANVPHLTEMQKKYVADGFVVIGATSPDTWGNTLEKVRSFIAAKSPGYSIAMLPPSGGIHRNPWFRQARIESLPTAFLIGPEGRIAFIGDPMMIDDALVRGVTSGSFDYEAGRRVFLADLETNELMKRIQKSKDRNVSLTLAPRIIANGSAHVLTWLSSTLTSSEWKTDGQILADALAASKRAVKLTHRRAPGALSELAHVWFLRGDVEKAVEVETEAVALSEGPMRDAQMEDLRKYRAARR